MSMPYPCMCGGCTRCLHDQGLDCENPDCRRCSVVQDEQDRDGETEVESGGTVRADLAGHFSSTPSREGREMLESIPGLAGLALGVGRKSRRGVEGHAADGGLSYVQYHRGLIEQRNTHPLNDPESPRYGPAPRTRSDQWRGRVRKRPAGIKPGRLLFGLTSGPVRKAIGKGVLAAHPFGSCNKLTPGRENQGHWPAPGTYGAA